MFSMILLSLLNAVEAPPAILQDAVIEVRMKDGKVATFSANEWKVVPRNSKKNFARSDEVRSEGLSNRVRALAGYGVTGRLDSSKIKNGTKVEPNRGLIGGLGYDRKITRRMSIGAEIQSNGSLLLGIGFDF